MAQVWVSYSELGELCDCSPQIGRAHAVNRRWPEQIGRDGLTRVLLPDDLAHDFMVTSSGGAHLALDRIADASVVALSRLSLPDSGRASHHDASAPWHRTG